VQVAYRTRTIFPIDATGGPSRFGIMALDGTHFAQS